MTDTKPWWQSTSIWGSVVAIIAMVASFFGFTLDADAQQTVLTIITEIVGVVGAAIALIGRIRAKTTVTLTK